MPFPLSFAGFVGNTPTVENLRAAVAAGRLPHSLIVTGPRGTGKYTLAMLLTLALECKLQPREQGTDGRSLAGFCGTCVNCTRILASTELETRIEEAVAAREEMREVDKKETRILVQTHPDVLILPPDPPQLLIKLGQVRTLIARSRRAPSEAPASVFVISTAAFMKEAANSLLKVLEEPPAYAHILILTENIGELLPTIRSRCAIVRLGAMATAEIEQHLAAAQPELTAKDRALIARLSEGAPGRAFAFDLVQYQTARLDALTLLRNTQTTDHTALFKMTEGYRAGAEGQIKTTALLRAVASLLEDILLLKSGASSRLRNIDIERELRSFADSVTFAWIESAMRSLDAVQSGLRRNLLRNVSLDAMAVELEMMR